MQISKTIYKALWLLLSAPTLGLLSTASHFAIANEEAPAWSYGGTENSTHWGDIDQAYKTCKLGRDQSPINLENAVEAAPANITFNYQPAPLEVFNNGHTVQVNYAPGSTVSINGETYDLLQFHFHTPSEHLFEGEAAPMEVHLVHRNAAKELAVVGIAMVAGEADPIVEQIWANIPEASETKQAAGVMINAADLLPSSLTYQSYIGSLTTPPCSEAVKWNVMVEPIEVSEEQIETFSTLYQVNARPVQPTNGRQIERHGG